MSNLIRCPACRGTKNIGGLGGMTKKCMACKGIGHVLDGANAPLIEKKEPVLCDKCKDPIVSIVKPSEPGIYKGNKPGPKPKVKFE